LSEGAKTEETAREEVVLHLYVVVVRPNYYLSSKGTSSSTLWAPLQRSPPAVSNLTAKPSRPPGNLLALVGKEVRWTLDSQPSPVEYVGVDHRRADVAMSQ
jgi:hypothetical protein